MVNVGQMAALWGVPILMAELGGWRSAYQLAAIAIVPVLVAWLLFAKENRMPDHESRLAVPHESGSPIVAALKRKEFLLLGIGAAGASIPYVAVMTFWPMYATQVKGLPLETVGPILSVVAVGSMIASFIAGVLSDKIGLRKPQPLIAGLLLPLAYFALLQFNSIPLLTAVAFLIGFGACIFVPVILTVPFELKEIKPQEIAIGIGFMIALTNAGAALGSQLAGILIEGLGLYAALAVLCASPLTLSLCVLLCAETGPRMRANPVDARGRQ